MHEYSIAESVVETVVKEYELNHKHLIIKIGSLSGIFKDPLAFFLIVLLEEKRLEDLILEIKEVLPQFKCVCGHHYISTGLLEGCPICEGYERSLIEGMDCTIEFGGDIDEFIECS